MKRPASPTASDRPAKVARLDSAETIFDSANERPASTLQDAFDSSCYISGTIVMAWPFVRASRKLQLECDGGWKLNVELRGPGIEKLPLAMKTKIGIALRGARIESLKTSSAHTHLKFRLICEDGAIIRTEYGAVIDSQTASPPEVPAVPVTPAPTPPNPPSLAAPTASVQASAVDSTPNPPEVQVSPPLARPSNTLLRSSREAEDAKRLPPQQVPMTNSPGPSAQQAVVDPIQPLPSPVSPVVAVTERVLVPSSQSDDDSMEEYTAGSSTTETPRPKQHRVRKRDSRNSERGTLHERRHRRIPGGISTPVTSAAGSQPSSTPVTPGHKPPASTPRSEGVDGNRTEYLTLRAVKDVRLNTKFSTIGVVSACGGVKPTRSSEFSLVLYLTDDTMSAGEDHFYVQCFSKNKNWLPNVKPGQIILFRNLKLSVWQQRLRGYAYKDSLEWVAFDAEEGEHFVSDPSLNPALPDYPFVRPTRDEIERFILLSDWWRTVQEGTIIIPVVPQGRPQLLIQDVQPTVFFDCVVEILRTFNETHCTSIYASDYTSNELNKDLGTLTHPFPSGKRTLKLALFGEQKDIPIECGPGHYYAIRNVRPKIDSAGFLEGVLNGSSGERLCLTRLDADDEQVIELVKRRAAYWEEVNNPSAKPQPSGAVARCWHLQQPRYTIAEVKQSELLLAKFRVRARITEFFPHNVEDFVILWCRKCDKAVTNPQWSSCVECGDDRGRYKGFRFRFCIRVEDESGDTIDVNVEGDDAVTFLANMAPADLRENKASMHTLKTRLGAVFGNLFEVHERLDRDEIVKAEPGPAFDFCVHSWIMEGHSQRAYNLFGCSIII